MGLRDDLQHDVDAINGRLGVVHADSLPWLASPCASCPFVEGNDRELARAATKFRGNVKSWPMRLFELACAPVMFVWSRVHPKSLAAALRKYAKRVNSNTGVFICHSTIYDLQRGGVRGHEEFKRCAGAHVPVRLRGAGPSGDDLSQ